MTIGERIKQRRKELGMNAEQLAEKIGKSAATVYRYENGDIERVDSNILMPIADALNTTPGYLMGWEEPKPPHRPDFFPASAIRPLSEMHHQRVPMIGSVAAGEPIMGGGAGRVRRSARAL